MIPQGTASWRDHILSNRFDTRWAIVHTFICKVETAQLVIQQMTKLLWLFSYRRDNKEPLQKRPYFFGKPVRYHTVHCNPIIEKLTCSYHG